MKRTVHYSGIVGVLVIVIAASVLAQSRTGTSSSRQRRQVQAPPSWSADPQVGFREGETPAEFQARHQREFQERMAEMQRRAAEMQRRAEESRNNAIRQAVGATDDQWRQIKPKLDLIGKLKAEAEVCVDPGAFGGMSGFQGNAFSFGGGFVGGAAGGGGFGTMGGSGQPGQNRSQFQSWSWPSGATDKTPGEMTDGEALCAQLQDLMRDPTASPEEITQKVAALRQIRKNARQRLARARQILRETLAPAQETPLIAMGYLD
ncbi:MAG: hypothetical protein JW741_21435 [Sedimentisphaerales bacterium]|nr:hypothetical protein [Sedimentisphaerales bacterium]